MIASQNYALFQVKLTQRKEMSKFPEVLHNDYILHCRRLKGDRETCLFTTL